MTVTHKLTAENCYYIYVGNSQGDGSRFSALYIIIIIIYYYDLYE